MAIEIAHDEVAHRIFARVDGEDCVLEYSLDDKRMTITHTLVPAAVGGRGIAADLMRHALQIARARGWQVVPECTYADTFMRRHTQYADLL